MKRLDKPHQDKSEHTNSIGRIPESILWYNFFINLLVLIMACFIVFYFPYKQIIPIKVYIEEFALSCQDSFSNNYDMSIKFMEKLKEDIHINDKVILKNISGREYVGRVKSELDTYKNGVLVQFEALTDKVPIQKGEYEGKIVISRITIWRMLISLNERIFNP